MKNLFSLFFLIICISCATQNKKDSVPGNMAGKIFDFWKDMKGKIGETTSEKIKVERVKLERPVRIGTYFLPDPSEDWAWEKDEKDLLLKNLRSTPGIAEVQELYGLGNSSISPRELRERAAQQGLDTLLIIQGRALAESSLNTKAVSYLVLLPAFFVKGNNVRSEFETEAILWDVRSSYIHTGAKAEGDWKMERPLLFPQKTRAIRKSREESIRELTMELTSNIRKLL